MIMLRIRMYPLRDGVISAMFYRKHFWYMKEPVRTGENLEFDMSKSTDQLNSGVCTIGVVVGENGGVKIWRLRRGDGNPCTEAV